MEHGSDLGGYDGRDDFNRYVTDIRYFTMTPQQILELMANGWTLEQIQNYLDWKDNGNNRFCCD